MFEGRVGVRVGESPAVARAEFEAAVAAADTEAPPIEIAWTGGAFASGETDPAHPWVARVRAAVAAERGEAPVAGVPWGADMRLYAARGRPDNVERGDLAGGRSTFCTLCVHNVDLIGPHERFSTISGCAVQHVALACLAAADATFARHDAPD